MTLVLRYLNSTFLGGFDAPQEHPSHFSYHTLARPYA